jgi:amino acid permease
MIFSELEVTELAAEYLGQHGKLAYQTALFLPTFIGLLAYAQVFNASFQSQIWPNCPAYIPVLFFGIIFVPFSCMDLVEQVRIISCMFTL